MNNTKKYKILKIILLLNPLPATVFILGMSIIFMAQIKFINKTFTQWWWIRILFFTLIFAIFEGVSFVVVGSFFDSYESVLYYLNLKGLDLIIGYLFIRTIEKKDLYSLKKMA